MNQWILAGVIVYAITVAGIVAGTAITAWERVKVKGK